MYNSILIVVDKFTKWGYFIACKESMSVKELSKVYIKKVFVRYGILIKIILNKNIKFILVF
jgi:hypothetical protein